MRARFGTTVRVESAGLAFGEPDAFAQAIMREIGMDMDVQPTGLNGLDLSAFDIVIALSEEAFARVKEMVGGSAAEFWRIPDPSMGEGSREQRLAAYRQARDVIAARIAERFPGADA